MTRPGLLVLAFALAACGVEEEGDADVLEVEPSTETIADLKADAASGNVELKVTIRRDQLKSALSKFKLTDAAAEQRTVYFYDTPSLRLFEAGLILRGRKVKNGADDSTVKLRPMVASQVARSWFSIDGFKCEEDRTGAKSVESCSLTVVQDTGEIDAVAKARRGIDKLFSTDQESFADAYASAAWRWDELRALGPITARAWKFSVRGFGPKLSAERWTLPDGTDLLEISTKVTRAQADATAGRLDALLSSRGFDTSTKQETKTRVALEFFDGR